MKALENPIPNSDRVTFTKDFSLLSHALASTKEIVPESFKIVLDKRR